MHGCTMTAADPSTKGITSTSSDVLPLADHVAKLVMTKFSELTDGMASPYARRKVLAGVVMTLDRSLESAQVVCVTTGTKCVKGDFMSINGLALNDCHAEVLARRCLRKFLFEQLQFYAANPDSNTALFERHPDNDTVGGYRLKAGVQFHLYVSTAPCGDSRLFSMQEKTLTEPDRHPNRKARGQLRTKIETGEGTIPITEMHTPTWDGIMQGERLVNMSCSDKVARWNVIGVQGRCTLSSS